MRILTIFLLIFLRCRKQSARCRFLAISLHINKFTPNRVGKGSHFVKKEAEFRRFSLLVRLVVLSLDLEIRLRMVADGAYIRRLLADDDVPTVSTLPNNIAVL